MAESVIVFVLEQISTFLHSQISNLGGEVERDVQFIRDELGSMRAFLRDAEAKEDEVFELKEWVNQVRELAYDMEDVLDEFLLRFARRRAIGFRGQVRNMCRSIKSLKARGWISSQLKDLKARVTDISERHKRYQPQYGNQGSAANLDNGIRATSILVEETELVGIGAPKTELLSQILADNSNLKVVGVVGMGGLGKTTLVREVFDDIAVQKRFQIRVWITISQTFHVIGIIKDTIRQIFNQINKPVPPLVAESSNVISLSAFVNYFLRNRSYIFVLDDVWSVASWDALKSVFSRGGRVLLTTRIADVASAACSGSNDHIHKMEPLSDGNSWTLFCKRTFGGNDCPPHLKDVSAKILEKCEGLPLAIATIGGVLAGRDKNEQGQWEMILHSLDREVEGSDQLDRVKRIMLLSYNDLPHYLKSCLSYMSIYPEDWAADVPSLLHCWIAEGFIQEKPGMSSYDVAALYANELVNRSLLQVVETYVDGTLRYCGVHDLLRDFIVSKGREDNFLAVAVGNYNGQSSKKLRRLAIHHCIENPNQQMDHSFKSLQTLQFRGENSHVSAALVSKFLRSDAKLLKVLNLSGAPLQHVPKEVFNLFHLKHLCLQRTQVRKISKLIGNLQNLEILDLFFTKVRELPAETFELTKLSSLLVWDYVGSPSKLITHGFKPQGGIGKLLSLEYLDSVEADDGEIVTEIGKLTKLKRLGITKLRKDDGKELLCSLMKLTNLEILDVSSARGRTLDLQHSISPTPQFLKWLQVRGHIERIPQWVKSLQNLTILFLVDSKMKEDDEKGGIGFLPELPNLLHLTFHYAYEGQTLYFRSGGFQKLRHLRIWRLERLKWVRVEDDHSLPNLQILEMINCKQIEELPLDIRKLKKLKELSLKEMSHELVQIMVNLGEVSEEYPTLAHIPVIKCQYWENNEWHSHLPFPIER